MNKIQLSIGVQLLLLGCAAQAAKNEVTIFNHSDREIRLSTKGIMKNIEGIPSQVLIDHSEDIVIPAKQSLKVLRDRIQTNTKIFVALEDVWIVANMGRPLIDPKAKKDLKTITSVSIQLFTSRKVRQERNKSYAGYYAELMWIRIS